MQEFNIGYTGLISLEIVKMFYSYFNIITIVKALLLEYFIILIFWTQSSTDWSHYLWGNSHCDILNSSAVRKLVEKKWTPTLNKYGVSLPIECPLNLSRNMLGVREKYKFRSSSHWKCRKCGKGFYTEKQLDLHLETRHSELITKVDDSVCFADYCDVMRCDILKSTPLFEEELTSTGISIWSPSLNNGYDNSPKSTSSDILKQKNKSEPNNNGVSGQTSRQLIPHDCDEEYFAQLRQKCNDVIWKCMEGLISILGKQEFQQLKDELESSSCSFLSCSRYGDMQDCPRYHRLKGSLRPFLIVIGALFISLCLALAYYFAWIYTQSAEERLGRQNDISSKLNFSIKSHGMLKFDNVDNSSRNRTSHI